MIYKRGPGGVRGESPSIEADIDQDGLSSDCVHAEDVVSTFTVVLQRPTPLGS